MASASNKLHALERWLPIPDFEGLYEVSDQGRVRRVGVRGGLIACSVTSPGYRMASLWKDGKPYNVRVHLLVLRAFVGPCPPGCVARHWPDCSHKLNNRLDNLMWATQRRNMQDRKYNKVIGPWKLTPEQAREIKLALQSGETGRSIAKRYGVHVTTISSINVGRDHADVII